MDLTPMAKILEILSAKYATRQTAWDNVEPYRQTLENLEERLNCEEAMLSVGDDEETSAVTASKCETKTEKEIRAKTKVETSKYKEGGQVVSLWGIGAFRLRVFNKDRKI